MAKGKCFVLMVSTVRHALIEIADANQKIGIIALGGYEDELIKMLRREHCSVVQASTCTQTAIETIFQVSQHCLVALDDGINIEERSRYASTLKQAGAEKVCVFNVFAADKPCGTLKEFCTEFGNEILTSDDDVDTIISVPLEALE